MKNIFRKRTEDEIDLLKDDALKVFIEVLKIIAINVLSTWAAVLIVLCIYGPKSLSADGRVEVRESLDLNFILAYLFMLGMTACLILMTRGGFTYGDPVAEWNAAKKGKFIRNAIAYVLVNIPVTLYFVIEGVANVYRNANTTTNVSGVAKLNTAENIWIANFFAPQATFYRLTRSIFFGVVINIAIYIGFIAIIYFCIKLKPPKESNNYVAPIIEDKSANDDMNAVD